jgi:phosphatidate cytidylyltransferase
LQLPLYALLGAVAALATEFGDLVESAIKRKVGIKDMGKLLPGHGGILDRIDGSIYAAVVVYVVFYLMVRA